MTLAAWSLTSDSWPLVGLSVPEDRIALEKSEGMVSTA